MLSQHGASVVLHCDKASSPGPQLRSDTGANESKQKRRADREGDTDVQSHRCGHATVMPALPSAVIVSPPWIHLIMSLHIATYLCVTKICVVHACCPQAQNAPSDRLETFGHAFVPPKLLFTEHTIGY